MKRLALLLVLAASPAAAQRTIVGDTIGCRDKALFERYGRMAAARDRKAADALIEAGVAAGNCRMIEDGEKVRIEDADSRLECVGTFGSAAPCLWTAKGQTRP